MSPADYREKSPKNPGIFHFRRLQNFLLASAVHLLFFWPQTDQFRPYFDHFFDKKLNFFDRGRIIFSIFARSFTIYRYLYSFSAPKRGVQSIPRGAARLLVFLFVPNGQSFTNFWTCFAKFVQISPILTKTLRKSRKLDGKDENLIDSQISWDFAPKIIENFRKLLSES